MDDSFALPEAAFGQLAPRTDPHGRVSIVLVLNSKREVLVHRGAPGLFRRWTSPIVRGVDAHESYEAAAAHALRDAWGERLPGLRFVDRTFVDAEGGRTFLAVFCAIRDGPAPEADAVFVPLYDVARDVRAGDTSYDPLFARAFRVLQGEP